MALESQHADFSLIEKGGGERSCFTEKGALKSEYVVFFPRKERGKRKFTQVLFFWRFLMLFQERCGSGSAYIDAVM